VRKPLHIWIASKMIFFLNCTLQMNNRSEVLKEYYHLIQKLNTTNRTRNEKTELHFLLKETKQKSLELFCTSNNEFFLLIGKKEIRKWWFVDTSFEYQVFGAYLMKHMSHHHEEEQIHSAIKNALRRLFTVESFD
jgi:hypothetical protein